MMNDERRESDEARERLPFLADWLDERPYACPYNPCVSVRVRATVREGAVSSCESERDRKCVRKRDMQSQFSCRIRRGSSGGPM